MKHFHVLAAMLLACTITFAQTDTTKKEATVDTIKVGNFIIIKKDKTNAQDSAYNTGKNVGKGKTNITINIGGGNNSSSNKKKSNISTNWWIFDIGFANYRDQTTYPLAQSGGYLKQIGNSAKVDANTNNLNAGKSSNFNIWFFMQKLNIAQHNLNLKYGLGFEMYNFRYERSLSYRNDPVPYAFSDTIGFTKNKLFVKYLTVPLMVNFNATPEKKKGFSFSAGVSAGYLINSRNKQISAERGKVKTKGDFDLNPWRLAAIGEIGLGPVRLFGSYSFNALHKDVTQMEQYPYSVGVRFSNW
ncbi:outer membrane beta-barrel protein [Parasediminibacterium paludis]|uniref:Outer membrane beta-barrel protein n=1 Tax=Parasediminibacterium paludis TaxID=908966 RepID=A0ABV8Q1L7_9BACT